MVESIELFTLSRAQKRIELDLHLPARGTAPRLWYLPIAFFEKERVAPDLEVVDAAGDTISVPTKRESMALTAEAIAELDRAGAIECGGEKIDELIWQVISSIPLEAYVVRAIAEGRLQAGNDLLLSLLRRLEDSYLLWVPLEGDPASAHRISISRRQPQHRNSLTHHVIKEVSGQLETAVGTAHFSFETPTGFRYPAPFAVTERMMQWFGLVPLAHEQEVPDARRAASFHLRVYAPEGFVVRDVQLDLGDGDERMADSLTGRPSPEDHPDVSLQGKDSEVAHLHCARKENHQSLTMYTIFGIRDGLMTLWATAVVFTAVLLWGVHRAAPYPVDGGPSGVLELSGAILLLGPALASAWAIRTDTGEVLERFMIGARGVLLLSAALSVLAALNLAGIRPAGWSYSETIELYAALGYVAAIPISVAWMVSQRATWFLYRDVLTTPARNLACIAGIAALCVVFSFHDNPGDRALGLVLLAVGLTFAMIGSNRAGMDSVRVRLYPFFAFFGLVVALAIAGYYLDLYGSHFDAGGVHLVLLLSQLSLAIGAATAACMQFWNK
ncbi:MAG TPA: hypothetical protein VF093_04620 [Solirubrobacterales bacterium]